MTPRSSQAVDAPLCSVCGGELIQYEDGPDGTLECAWCDGDDPGQVATVDPAFYPGLVE